MGFREFLECRCCGGTGGVGSGPDVCGRCEGTGEARCLWCPLIAVTTVDGNTLCAEHAAADAREAA